MCRGLALAMNKNMNIVCEGKSSHTDSGMDDGEYLKLELIIDDSKPEGYCLEVDENTNDAKGFECYLTKQGKLKKDTEKYILNEIKKNEAKYLRWLLQNMTFARGENQNADSWKAGRDQDANCWKAERNQDANCWKAKEDQKADGWEAGQTQYRKYNKAKKIIVSYTETENEENNNFINMLSDRAEHNELDWDYIVELARKGYHGNKMDELLKLSPDSEEWADFIFWLDKIPTTEEDTIKSVWDEFRISDEE